jgi:predicted dehydrogenase
VWQDKHYVSIDFGNGTIHKVRSVADWDGERPPLEEQHFSLDKGDALQAEIDAFLAAAGGQAECIVTGRDGLAALELAERIIEDIDRRRRSD